MTITRTLRVQGLLGRRWDGKGEYYVARLNEAG